MALELEGTIIRKLDIQSGESARGKWAKQEFIIEYQEGNFPSQACFNVWGEDRVKEMEKFNIGDLVKVSFNISSREYNSRWYTDLRVWRIEKASAQGAAAQPASQQPSAERTAAPAQTAAPAGTAEAGGEADDDLPF